MASYTLDDIVTAAEAKYSSTDIQIGGTTCRLMNPLRLSKERRAELIKLQGVNIDEETDIEVQVELMRDSLRIICETEHQGEVLLEALGDDLALMAELFARYNEGTQLGEASPSAD